MLAELETIQVNQASPSTFRKNPRKFKYCHKN